MSQHTKNEVLHRLRRRYASAGPEHKRKLITQAVELLGYHRKSAIRALGAKPKPPASPALVLGRPRHSIRVNTILTSVAGSGMRAAALQHDV